MFQRPASFCPGSLLIMIGIIGKNLLSPGMAVVDKDHWGRNANPGELPELRYASEIYWGYWVRDNPNVKNLCVYGACNIVNDDTVLLVARARRNSNQEKLTPWPGAVFDASSDKGKALIGKQQDVPRRQKRIPNYNRLAHWCYNCASTDWS
jgi:hypothetical protein